jgi:methylglutaconyl-CoA hydratase
MAFTECNRKHMHDYKYIIVKRDEKIDEIYLNRPESHNAFDPIMIKELTEQIILSESNDSIRLIIIRGMGDSFSSGADIHYLQSTQSLPSNENIEDAEKLSNLFYTIYKCSKPVFTIAHGNVTGGANGLIAASDYALCTHRTLFRFSETKLGLIPATISPYIVRRMGEFKALELMLTGKPFSGQDAEEYRLVNKAVSERELNSSIQEIKRFYLSSAPQAIIATKKLLHSIAGKEISEELSKMTAKTLAEVRQSEEAIEGLKAWLEKRKPYWNL